MVSTHDVLKVEHSRLNIGTVKGVNCPQRQQYEKGMETPNSIRTVHVQSNIIGIPE